MYQAKLRVRYAETDQMGVVYYGNYLTWFEVGRNELFRSFSLPYTAFEEAGFLLVVTEAHCYYHRPARYDDLITVAVEIESFSPVRVKFNYQVFNEEQVMLVAGSTTHAFVSKSERRPVNMKKACPDLWRAMAAKINSIS